MKSIRKIVHGFEWLFGAALMAFAFTGCPGGNDPDTPEVPETPETTEYVIEFDQDISTALTVNEGEKLTLTVKADSTTVGTWLVDEENLPEEISVEKDADGNFVITGVKETSSNVSFVLYPEEAAEGDTSFDKTVTVSVYNPNFALTIKLDEDLQSKVSTMSLSYHQDGTGYTLYTADVSYTAGDVSGTVLLPKANANSDGYFSNLELVAKDADDQELAVELDKAWFCYYSTNKDYLTEITASVKTESEMTLTLTFEGFTVPETGSVTVNYGAADSSEASAVVARVSETSYTAKISNSHVNSSKYFKIEVLVNDGTEDITGFEYFSVAENINNRWFEFNQDGAECKLILSNETWNVLVNGKEVEASGTLVKVLEPAAFTGLTITKLKIATSGASDDNYWWAKCCYETYEDGADWVNATGLAWDDGYTAGYSVTITDADYIAKIVANGLYLAGGYTKFYVSYVGTASSGD